MVQFSRFAVILGVVLCQVNSSIRTAYPDDVLTTRPNFVVVLCDDLGYGDLGCCDHPHIKTPNLDQLAHDGIRFTSCYSAAPVCSPSRVGLLTGRSPNRAGVYDWIPAARGSRTDARDQVHMRRSEVTVSSLLKKAGYATCMAGKWHCNSHFNSQKQPQPGDFGFDHWFATQNNAAPSHENPKNFVRNAKEVGLIEGYSCQIVTDEAIRWLDDQTKTAPDQPFFMFVPFHEPHEPVASPEKLVAKYRSVARNDDEAQFFANVENVDLAVGRLLQSLKELDRLENTLIVFTSDNGPETLKRYRGAQRSYGQPGPLRGMKLWTTEAGFRVAGIMRWDAKIKPGQVSSEPVSSLDLLPTFCKLAGATIPKDLNLDGTDALAALNGGSIQREKPLFWCYYNSINEHRVAMRDGRWKLLAKLNHNKLPKFENVYDGNLNAVRSAELTNFELYEVTKDIDEGTNVIDKYPEEATALKSKLRGLYQELTETSHYWKTIPSSD